MINPRYVTNYNRASWQLQEFLIFSICVAGKKADATAVKVAQFLNYMEGWVIRDHGPEAANLSWFKTLSHFGQDQIESGLRVVKMGQYNRIAPAIYGVVNKIDTETCTVEDLEAIHGIGPKTARFFILHSRENVRCAVLDTHILKHLKKFGVANVPDSTPQSAKQYARLEEEFLKMVDLSGLTPAQYDLQVWKTYAK